MKGIEKSLPFLRVNRKKCIQIKLVALIGCFFNAEKGDKLYKCKKIGHFKYKKIRRGWLVVNCKTGSHSHFKSEYGCYLIIKFLLNGIYPNNVYLQESWERLKDNTERKQRYINVNKGKR